MAKKRIQPSRAVEPPHIDTIQLIDGIGPAIERRLHSIGIYTFAQLAALSPADIAASVADIAGLTTERIIKQDWIGQARRLASELHAASMQAEVAWQDEEPVVADAIVGEEIVAETHHETLLEPQPYLPPSQEANVVWTTINRLTESASVVTPAKRLTAKRTLSGTLYLRDLEMITTHPYEHSSIVRSNHPFKLRVTLDFRQIETAPEAELTYQAIIYGRQLGARQREKMGEARGSINTANDAAVEVEGIVNSPGFYRLEVIVTLFQANTTIPGLIAMIEGGPLHFY